MVEVKSPIRGTGLRNSVKSPTRGTGYTNNVKSPISAVERTKRRQSLTGIQAPLPNNSRRSSLGGKPVLACKLKPIQLPFYIYQMI